MKDVPSSMLIAAIMMCVLKSASAYSQCVGTLQHDLRQMRVARRACATC